MKRVLILICILSVLLSFPALALEDGTDSASDSLSETDLVDSPVESDPVVSDPSDSVDVSADTSDSESGVTVNVTIQQPETSSTLETDLSSSETGSPDILDSAEDSSAYRTFTVVSPDVVEGDESLDGSSVLSDVVVSVLGEYERRTQTVREMDSDGNILATSTEYVPGLAGLDYEWLAGAALFALLLYGLLRMIGGLLKR